MGIKEFTGNVMKPIRLGRDFREILKTYPGLSIISINDLLLENQKEIIGLRELYDNGKIPYDKYIEDGRIYIEKELDTLIEIAKNKRYIAVTIDLFHIP